MPREGSKEGIDDEDGFDRDEEGYDSSVDLDSDQGNGWDQPSPQPSTHSQVQSRAADTQEEALQDPLIQDPLILPQAGYVQISTGHPSGSVHSLEAPPVSGSSLEANKLPGILDFQPLSLGQHQLESYKQPQDEQNDTLKLSAVDLVAAKSVTADPPGLISPRLKPVHNPIKHMETQQIDQQPAADGPLEPTGGSSIDDIRRDKPLAAASSVKGRRAALGGTDYERCGHQWCGHATYFCRMHGLPYA